MTRWSAATLHVLLTVGCLHSCGESSTPDPQSPDVSCKPCSDDSDCYQGTCINLDGTLACVSPCGNGNSCDSGYECVDVDGSERCKPTSGSCTCSTATVGQTRACQIENEFGTCFGQETCDSAKGWLGCSAATPAAEVCDVIDNDCDGLVDEDFIDVNQPCTVGTGACQGLGFFACTDDGTGTQCNAVAGTGTVEVCNDIDDDCNTQIDEGWADKGMPCTVGIGGCARVGFHICNPTDPQGTTICSATPGASAAEICNGTDDDNCGLGPIGTGDGHYPCASIDHALDQVGSGHTALWVAEGAYHGDIALADGISLLGGYNATKWQRDPTANWTAIFGVDSAVGHNKAVRAEGISSTTVFDGFAVHGANASAFGSNSYAVYVRDSGAGLSITNNTIYAGNGGRGASGSRAADGPDGQDGKTGSNCIDTETLSCSGSIGEGGAGGTSDCEAEGGKGAATGCPSSCSATTKGEPGTGAEPGLAGSGANDWQSNAGCSTVGTCGNPNQGGHGGDGGDGSLGALGAGCATGTGTVELDEWKGASGSAGGMGTAGSGGGGGGAGGGLDDNDSCGWYDQLGGAGGGGGSGGCPGTGGVAGNSGGGSFGIFVVFSPPSASLPVITGNIIFRGSGGDGGAGGLGGAGGRGGGGRAGGTVETCAQSYALGPGGNGGNGGQGGHGGGGGGGCGGVAFGIYASGASDTPTWNTSNTFTATGSGGASGPGGASLGNSGTDGSTGPSGDTNF